MNILIVSNTVTEHYLSEAIHNNFKSKDLTITYISPEECYLPVSEELLCSADIILVLLALEYLDSLWYTKLCGEEQSADAFANQIRSIYIGLCDWIIPRTTALVMCCTFEDYCCEYTKVFGARLLQNGIIDKINLQLRDVLHPSTAIIDTKRMIAEVGISNSYDIKGKHRWNVIYSKAFLDRVAEEIHKQYLISKGITPKCIVIDCDNVLWKGVLSEDGIQGIQMGPYLGVEHRELQSFLVALHCHGVILALCSKNDAEDVLRVFREHSGMVLKEDHIAAFKINWENKLDNLQDIATELNIDLNSIVFVDDSEFEINLVRQCLPEITTILYNKNDIFEKLSRLNLNENVKYSDISLRHQTYKTNACRKALRTGTADFKEYIRSLEMKVQFKNAAESELTRISDLTQRANKFTNGVRYSTAELIEKHSNPDYSLRSLYVSDKFSNLGLVGAVGIECGTLDLLVLSCRALGRTIETDIINLLKDCNISSYRFLTTNKNNSVLELLKQLNIDKK